MDSLTIAIIEDEEPHFNLMKRSIVREIPTAAVHHFQDANTCLEKFEGIIPDIIVADYLIPGMNGIEFLKVFNRKKNDIPVIMITGQGNESVAVQAMKLGAWDYLVKSTDFFSLIPGVITKVVRQKKIRDSLREAEEKYRIVVENANEVIVVIQDGMLKFLNPKLISISGYSEEELTTRPFVDFVHPDDCEIVIENNKKMFKEDKKNETYELRVIDKKGNIKWLQCNSVLIEWEGESAILSFMNDITKRKQAEEKLQKNEKFLTDLINNSQTGISIIQNDQVVFQNPEQERLFGPLPRSAKMTDIDNIHPEDIEKVQQFYKIVTSGEVKTIDTVFRIYDSDCADKITEMKWINCRASFIEYENQEAVLINMMDISRIKEMENLLNIQDKMASLGRVAAGLSHEIRNPLSGINIYVSILKKLHHKDRSEEKVEEILNNIDSASIKMESIIRRVLDFAKPGEPKFTLIRINEPITDAIKLTAVMMRKRGINVDTFLSSDLPRSYADNNLIEEMVINLLNNAAEAMKTMEDGKKIVVVSFVEDDRIIVQVSDSGPGVPEENRDKILMPYFTTKQEGTGIGLSLCHRIIKDHGGSIAVTQSKWGGAEFRIQIPINKSIG